MIIKLSKKECDLIKIECEHYNNPRAASIEALKIIQKNRGWVSDDAVQLIAQTLNIPISDIESIATFYNQIFRQPVGRHIIRYCDSIVCYILGCEKNQKILEDILNIRVGGTTEDNKFTLLPACCLGMCDRAPVIMIDEDIYTCVIPNKIAQLLRLY